MALGQCHETDRTAAVFVVVPAHQFCNPGAARELVIERLSWIRDRYFRVLDSDSQSARWRPLFLLAAIAPADKAGRQHRLQRIAAIHEVVL